ncbi:MAG: DNA replication and repair protein RecF [Prevotellaceae bacterium]|jgi:DNA replication and repair protein RecF|nr:DNA replication and repair protein RecF [Prevotellaceae bacterium]
MHLKHLSVVNFKNIRQLELDPAAKLTCLVGSNGEGKTNLLDALYLLSMCKSSAGLTDRQCICHGEDFFLVKGAYDVRGGEEVVSCGCTRADGKVFKRNATAYERLADHVGMLPLVMISPADSALISESGDERRRYLNSVIAQLDRSYLDALARYGKALQQRNKMLKEAQAFSFEVLNIVDSQLSACAAEVFDKRSRLVEDLTPFFQKYYELISQGKEQVQLSYASDLKEGSLLELLKQSFARDRALQFTSVGVHRDDLAMRLDGYPIKKLGSQGQQKTMLLALKLAQVELLQQRLDMPPMLLLDDIFDKLDMQRVKSLIGVISHSAFGQIFLTDTSKARVDSLLHEVQWDYKVLEMKGGELV